jgi:hypothetical protein
MGAPLFGYAPKHASPEEVHEDCVKDFDSSASRPLIWDGISKIVQETAATQATHGVLHIDSEFVEHVKEPSRAALVLEAHVPISRDVFEIWRRQNASEMMVETFLIGPRPTDEGELQEWEASRKLLMEDLTDNGRKGYPIIDLLACHAFTK